MKAWQVTAWGEPEEMQLSEVAVPEPRAGEVRIRNHAAALNFFDILLVQGKYQTRPPFPFTPGSEVAGVIEAVGEGVTGLTVGDRVLAMTSGGYAEQALAPAGKTFRIPDAMNFAEAAAMPVIYQTSYLALKQRARLQADEWLLVLAAAGGVGSSALQLGKALGARVIAAVGNEDKFDFCLHNDAANPHHTTIHYNGWSGDNPKDYTVFTNEPNKGFHYRFEELYVQTHIRLNDVLPLIATQPRVLEKPREEIWTHIRNSNKLVEQLYILDKQEAFGETTASAEHKKFASERLAAGAQMLRDLWWTAWVTSDPKLTPTPPPRPAPGN